MKKLMIMAMLLGVTPAAFAKSDGGCDKPKEVMTCVAEVQAPSEYTVHFETVEQRTTVTLKKMGKLLAEYPCFRKATTSSPDKPEVMMECYDPTTVDTGYRIDLMTADFAGRQWTTVTETLFTGMREVVKLPCATRGN